MGRFQRCSICLTFAVLTIGTSQGAASDSLPNVVLFLVDDMGWMDCGAYGSEYYETPHMDRLASRGMLFTQAYSANPLCSPTRASLLTGKYPARLGLTSASGHKPPLPPGQPRMSKSAAANRPVILPESLHHLALEEYTLAEAFRDAGYATGHFGKWHLGLNEEHWPEQQGYDVVFHGAPDPGPPSPNGYFSPYSFKAGTVTPGPEGEYIVDRVGQEAARFIEAHREEPFLACVWQYGVHGPWDHKEEYTRHFVNKVDPRRQQNNPVMASMLKSVDESLGRIVETLDRLGLTENTIVLFTSDNGGNVHSNIESDRQKQNVKPGHPQWRALSRYREFAGYEAPTNNAPLRAGKGTLYEGGVRIPFVAVWPDRIPEASKSTELISTIDVYPTLLKLAGVPLGQPQAFDGVSLADLLTGQVEGLERDAVFNFFPHGGPSKPPGVTIRAGDWKLIRWFETGPEYPSEHELYNLREDLGETTNLADREPQRVKDLDAALDRFLTETGALIPQPNTAYDPDSGGRRASGPLLGWVPKFCDTISTANVLRVKGMGRQPFLAKTGLTGEGPLEVRATLSSDVAGTGRVQWRTASQETFPKPGQSVRFELMTGAQTVVVPFVSRSRLAHIRFHLPPDSTIDIDRIELWRRSDTPEQLHAWDFRDVTESK